MVTDTQRRLLKTLHPFPRHKYNYSGILAVALCRWALKIVQPVILRWSWLHMGVGFSSHFSVFTGSRSPSLPVSRSLSAWLLKQTTGLQWEAHSWVTQHQLTWAALVFRFLLGILPPGGLSFLVSPKVHLNRYSLYLLNWRAFRLPYQVTMLLFFICKIKGRKWGWGANKPKGKSCNYHPLQAKDPWSGQFSEQQILDICFIPKSTG